ncbi:hypothetical protein M2160_005450 [Streptomyces sp. SAI-117]|uniref:PIN domain-containing protein n=1 Tax=Streptomyces sp. SAI-117 TaxID=2940546 RepID=UPI00247322C6|nr:PIN domain-containing protein [Streptomyces sp. SAI-117]MDH6570429.1 hypothetical protein [Streptomyces sp. SAI-117]
MIILDTSILRSFGGPDSSSADLLRTIKAATGERAAIAWMVREELAAQQAIKYQDLHERAAQAVDALRQATPGSLDVQIGDCDLERIREHWRSRWGSLVGLIPTPDEAVREALFREANCLPPCKESKNQKTGSRDAAIWLSAVDYAQENPDEVVYFVSANTKDFGDGTSYPYPMNEDIAGMTDRFFILTSMDEVASRFTEPAETDEALVTEILGSDAVLERVAGTAEITFPLPMDPTFECAVRLPGGRSVVEQASGWRTAARAALGSVEAIRTYRIGDREWCTASVEWLVTGWVNSALFGATWGAVTWTTAVLFNLDPDKPNLTILREAPPRPASDDAVEVLDLPVPDTTSMERALVALSQAAAAAQAFGVKRSGLQRAYERQIRMGETSPG